MIDNFELLRYYTMAIAKKWVFWIFLALDVIAIVVIYFSPTLNIPQIFYWGLAAFGVFWAGFQVYRDMAVKIPDDDKGPTGLAIPPNRLVRTESKPSIKISLLDGHQYDYALAGHDTRSNRITMPNATLTIHVRIENDGNSPAEVLSIAAKTSLLGYPLYSTRTNTMSENDSPYEYPIHMESGAILPCDIAVVINSGPTDSDVSFAADIKEFSTPPNSSQSATIVVRVVNPRGKPIFFEKEFDMSVLPLYEQYIACQ